MKQGNQMMKSMTPRATRLAVFALRYRGARHPAIAQSVTRQHRRAINRSAPARPAPRNRQRRPQQ